MDGRRKVGRAARQELDRILNKEAKRLKERKGEKDEGNIEQEQGLKKEEKGTRVNEQ